MLIHFLGVCNDCFFRVWQCAQWSIREQQQLDKYGFPPDDERYQGSKQTNYIHAVPESDRYKAYAMQYSMEWNMTLDNVLDLRYEDYYERTLLHKAIMLKHPEFEGDRGEWEYANDLHNKRLRN